MRTRKAPAVRRSVRSTRAISIAVTHADVVALRFAALTLRTLRRFAARDRAAALRSTTLLPRRWARAHAALLRTRRQAGI